MAGFSPASPGAKNSVAAGGRNGFSVAAVCSRVADPSIAVAGAGTVAMARSRRTESTILDGLPPRAPPTGRATDWLATVARVEAAARWDAEPAGAKADGKILIWPDWLSDGTTILAVLASGAGARLLFMVTGTGSGGRAAATSGSDSNSRLRTATARSSCPRFGRTIIGAVATR